MSTTQQRGFLARFVSAKLPSRTKRLIVLASLAALLPSRQKSFDDNALRKLNDLMQLGHEPKALSLPVYLTHAIWRDDKRTEIINVVNNQGLTSDPRAAARQVMVLIPEWLRYDDADGIMDDVERLISLRSEILA